MVRLAIDIDLDALYPDESWDVDYFDGNEDIIADWDDDYAYDLAQAFGIIAD